ncbi:sugar phosphate isomerase/epimerase [Verrucomicrobia bacterium]|jgi:L-ribulose-5-phosphate 3-epimerase|nr:sugar phosphate isomerase/epimerase [Verrucomicrobiota bacterium]
MFARTNILARNLGVALVIGVALQSLAADYKLGVQTWTLRNLNFDQMVEFCAEHEITNLQVIANHISPTAPIAEIKRKKAILDKHGLKVYTFGVAGTSMDKEKNRQLFEFAKLMGIKVIIVEPRDYRILDNLEELVKEYDIKIAIHNHGIKSNYGNPSVVRNLIMHRDARIGVCLDVGWVTSARFDAGKVFKDYKGRVYDIHLKDKKVSNTSSGDVATPAGIGEGDCNYKGLFAALREANYDGVLAIETDANLKDPKDFVVNAKKFVAENY